MSNLEAALKAAAEEAGRLEREIKDKTDDLHSYISYVELENDMLKKKIAKSSDLLKQLVEVLSEGQNS